MSSGMLYGNASIRDLLITQMEVTFSTPEVVTDKTPKKVKWFLKKTPPDFMGQDSEYSD